LGIHSQQQLQHNQTPAKFHATLRRSASDGASLPALHVGQGLPGIITVPPERLLQGAAAVGGGSSPSVAALRPATAANTTTTAPATAATVALC